MEAYRLITTAIKLAIKLTIKLKTKNYCSYKSTSSRANLAQVLQPSLAFCCSYNKMLMTAATVVQQLHGCLL